jgi:acrylyl-CoA reductase (NADPH)
MTTFKGILLSKEADQFRAALTDIDEKDMPEGDVVVRVEYSTLNYKDALAITNTSPIVRKWPMVAGIDAAGEVEESTHPLWKKGDKVVINGWGLSETHWGGLARKIRVKGEWCTRLPAGMTTRQAMAIGTAGYTAMLAVMALERQGVAPRHGPVIVTGLLGKVLSEDRDPRFVRWVGPLERQCATGAARGRRAATPLTPGPCGPPLRELVVVPVDHAHPL